MYEKSRVWFTFCNVCFKQDNVLGFTGQDLVFLETILPLFWF